MNSLRTLSLVITFMLSLGLSFSVSAHGDHEHGPSAKSSPKGGRMLETEELHVELVTKDKSIMLYVYDNELKPLSDVSVLKASFTTQLPRKEKTALNLKVMKDHFHGEFDKGSSHRYDLQMTLNYGGHSDELKWTIE